MRNVIIGISCYYHDSAAVILVDGSIVAAAQEERFSRVKNDAGFPLESIRYCLKEAGVSFSDIEAIVYYEKPLLKFERLLETYLKNAPRGFFSFSKSMPVWLKEKIYFRKQLKAGLSELDGGNNIKRGTLFFCEHHRSHAASAFFPSPYEEAAVLCLDGVGEFDTTSCWIGKGRNLKKSWSIHFPHSLGLLYSAFTYYCGFKVNSGEYKLMGLAPYGKPRYVDLILRELIRVSPNGIFEINLKYFDYVVGLRMMNRRFSKLFGRSPRTPESQIEQLDMDLAASIQVVTQDVILKLGEKVRRETKMRHLCLAGGVALNCVANGILARSGIFESLFVQPAAGDAGGALGAALSLWYEKYKEPRIPVKEHHEAQLGSFLGPSFSDEEVEAALNKQGLQFVRSKGLDEVARVLSDGGVVGWFQGRMEFGPRALGARSILADPRDAKMQRRLNLKIKYRESFRPFAPAVLAERADEWFGLTGSSAFMQQVCRVKGADAEACAGVVGLKALDEIKSPIPAVTHVDGSARVQTVHRSTNERFYELLKTFESFTGCPVLANTSFNVRGEPIVATPEDAIRCFLSTEMDLLFLQGFLVYKSSVPDSLLLSKSGNERDFD